MTVPPTVRSLSILPLVAATLMGGCAHYQAAPLPQRPALNDSLIGISQIPGRPLHVDEVAALAIARSPDLVAARTKQGVAEAQLMQAGVITNPSLTGAFLPLISGVGTVPAWNLGLTQDLKAIIIRGPKLRSARNAVAQVHADLLWQEWQVAGQARQLVIDLVQREKTRTILEEAVALLRHRYEVTQSALAAGNATLVTAAPSALGYQQARTNLQTLEQQQLQDRHKLNALLDLSPDTIVPLATNLDITPLDVAAARASLETLPERRPDLLALRFGYASQDETLRGAILAQFPDLILGGSMSSDNSKVINAGPNVQIGLPLFDRNQGNIAIARATREQLRAEYRARLDSTVGQAGALLSEMEQLRSQLVRVERDLPAARLAAERAATAFGNSALDERAYVDLVTNRFTKEQEVYGLQLSLLDRQVALETILGSGLPGVRTLGLVDPGTKGAAR